MSDIAHESLSYDFTALCDSCKGGRFRTVYKALEKNGLLYINNSKNYGTVLMRVGTDCLVNGGTVIQIMCDKITDWLRIVGYNGKKFVQLHAFNSLVNQQSFCHQSKNGTQTGDGIKNQKRDNHNDQVCKQ